MHRLVVLPVATLLLAGCASYTLIPPDDCTRLQRALTGKERDKFLRLSYFVTPFFGDGTKKLLTHVPPEEVRLLQQPDGTPILPGEVEKIIPVNTPVRIVKVEFPTPWVLVERILYTPRTQPWVYLEIPGEPTTHSFILVLRQQIETPEDFIKELERYLSNHDLTPLLSEWPEPVRKAINEKHALQDMPVDALEIAWGYPETKHISYDGKKNRVETWRYPGGRRSAEISEGKAVKLTPGPDRP